jgi:hypothetical protein
MPARKHYNATPAKFRAVLESGYELTGRYSDKCPTLDIKLYILSHRPEWGEYSSAWWSYNFKKCGLGVGKFAVERTGLRRKMLSIINAGAVAI